MSWVPLHIHTQYSILDSTVPIVSLTKRAKEMNMEALAITDSGNMYGHVDFYKACRAEGIKPILGTFLRVSSRSCTEKRRDNPSFPVLLFIKDKAGYRNLCKLSSIAHVDGFYYYPRIDKEILEKHSEGLICMSGGMGSYIAKLISEGRDEEALSEIMSYKSIFREDFYFEIKRMAGEIESDEAWVSQKVLEYGKNERKVNDHLIDLSRQLGIEYVATNEVRYLKKEDYKGHEVLINIQLGEPCEIWERDASGQAKWRKPNPKRRIYSSHEYYLKDQGEIGKLFSDIPKALSNSLEIAKKCNFEFNFKSKHYPLFIPPGFEGKKVTKKERLEAVSDYLYKICRDNIPKRYSEDILRKIQKKFPEREPLEIVRERLEYEFGVIASKNLSDYLLIVHDFISWAKGQNIPTGPGRGSVAGSIMSYLMGITEVEPIMFDLVFERFINPERVSYPDIDVDICMEKRDDVISYTIKKYGKKNVAQIITFGTIKARMAIRDVGRMLSVPLSKVDAIAKLIPEDINMTLSKALEIDPELRSLYKSDRDANMIIDIGKKIEGSIRNTSIHAAGIIISADPLDDHIPVCLSKDVDMLVTQFAMKPVESLGMLKIDFLGLKTLTAISKAFDQAKVDWTGIPLDDSETYALLRGGHTLGVFQLESPGMKELVRRLKIDRFEEIIAVGALYRPGPMDMIPSFINRKHKEEEIEIDHPFIKNILDETYGVMVYQEQVMQIASQLAGYSLGEGDMLRKAMGKKDKKEMGKQRDKFIAGAMNRGIEEQTALSIFDKIEKFASYGFNKSHATAYAYITYVTAFLKAHHPKKWMAALMTCDRDDLSKVAKFIGESKSMGIDILPPDVNEAGSFFVAAKSGIRFAMSGVKGIGDGVVEAIVEERKKGRYRSFFDFVKRIDKRSVGKKAIEVLIDAGAFDGMGGRDLLKAKLEKMYDGLAKEDKEREKGVLNFLHMLDEREPDFDVEEKPTTKFEKLKKEKELLGFYLTDHPMKSYEHLLKKLSCVSFEEFVKKERSLVRAAFIIDSVKIKIASKSQRKFAILKISDGKTVYELPVWPELYEKKMELLLENQLIYAILQIEGDSSGIKLQCHWLDDLTKIDESMIKDCDNNYDIAKTQVNRGGKRQMEMNGKVKGREVVLHIDTDKITLKNMVNMKNLFFKNPGEESVELRFLSNNSQLATVGDILFKVDISKIKGELEGLKGIWKIEVKA